MRFSVLGPLTATGEHGTVAVAGEKQRLLLTILLSRNGQPVSVDSLVDALWGDHPPDIPHKRLSWHVHRLRGSLSDADRIIRNDNGYALPLSDSELDAADFERLCDTAETAGRAGDPAAASEHWSTALRLWRGPAYGELGGHPLLRGEVARLSGLRSRAVEHRIGVDLDLGRHDELIGELHALVAEHPLRERFRVQLMLALYRAGRRSEALDVYRDTRDTLVEQLGVEPGAELLELHRDILRDASRLAAPPPPAPRALEPAARPRPAELPVSTTAFTGREPELEQLRQALGEAATEPVVISAVTGGGGIGKSALAIRCAHLVAHNYPDGQLYLNLRGATPGVAALDPAEALRRLLRSLNVDVPRDVSDTDELAARFRSAVSDQRLLLVLDDAADAGQVVPLLPGSPACGVLITSRNSLTQLDGAAAVRLDVLTPSDALRLFHRLTSRSESEPDTEIIDLCGRMPLAICVVAARLNGDQHLSVEHLADLLRSQSHRLGELDDGLRAVRSGFMVSYQGLDPDTARMFRRLGLHEGHDFSEITASALAGIPPDQAAATLERLAALHLIDATEPGRFAMHDLLRLFSKERAAADEPETESRQAIERMLHCYLATARNALRAYHRDADLRCGLSPLEPRHEGKPIADLAEAYGWGRSELANLPEITRQASLTGQPETAVAIAVATLPTLYYQGYWHQTHALCRTAERAAQRLGSLPHLSHAYRDLATIEVPLGLIDEGLDNAARFLDTCVELGDEDGQARAFHLQGAAYRTLGRLDEATDCMSRSLAICARTSSSHLEILVWNQFGMVHAQAQRMDEAAHAFEQTAALAERHGDHRNHVAAVNNLANLRRKTGDSVAAKSTFEEALSITRRTGLTGMLPEVYALWGIGDSLFELDRAGEAKRYWNDAAAILARLELITEAEQRAIAASDRPESPRVLH